MSGATLGLQNQRQETLGLFEASPLIDHVELAERASVQVDGKNLAKKNSGKFYTPESIALPLIQQTLAAAKISSRVGKIKIVDPFCGDGRLIAWTLPFLRGSNIDIEIHLWDYDGDAVERASSYVTEVGRREKLNITVNAKRTDSFAEFFQGREGTFDLVVTNPPWEVVKPDPKDLIHILDEETRGRYIAGLRDFSDRISRDFPLSRPAKTYGGWGVNLARVGTELSLRLAKDRGVVGIVTPSTIFADQNSNDLRKWLFAGGSMTDLNVFPAEMRLFSGVDQPSVSFVVIRGAEQKNLSISSHQLSGPVQRHHIENLPDLLVSTNHVLPVSIVSNPAHLDILSLLQGLPKLSDLEVLEGLWLGRELDETNYRSWVSPKGQCRFIKGRDVSRFGLVNNPEIFIDENRRGSIALPVSSEYGRIVWRDVSRPTQKRRVLASIVPPGCVAGNSLGVLYLRDSKNESGLLALLGTLSSFVFEFQLRAYLATAHISAGVMKKMSIPNWEPDFISRISELVKKRLQGSESAEIEIEIEVAKAYGLNREHMEELLGAFPKVSAAEKKLLVESGLWK